ncbi:MAG: hypothetical protein SF051_12460 [Elusimicrobiota bacterium]|nr:hypothetical protein [Elusimicrobiota bacterium]
MPIEDDDRRAGLSRIVRELTAGGSLSDIRVCELRQRDTDAFYVYLEHRNGKEVRIACPTDEAPAALACIRGWLARPETFPPPPPRMSSNAAWAIVWATFAVASVYAAWAGVRDFSSVVGWAYTDHFFGGFALSLVVFIAFWHTVAINPMGCLNLLLATPLLIFMTMVFTSAGMTVNARLGRQEVIAVRGRVIAMDDASFTAYLSGGKGRRMNAVPISRWRLTVQNEADGTTHLIEVPGWVASREKLAVGFTWEDRFYRGALGWRYRRGNWTAGWDGFNFVPRATPPY